MPRSQSNPIRVGLISLGCAKNLVDAEIMLGSLLKHGIEITNEAGSADVLIVNTCSFIDAAQEESVDTILESASVREANHRGQGLIVAGCLPQRFPDQLPELLPEVDVFMGIDQVADTAALVQLALERRRKKLVNPPETRRAKPRSAAEILRHGDGPLRGNPASDPNDPPAAQARIPDQAALNVSRRPQYIPDYSTPRLRLTPGHFAYVKIAEGCNHPCSFCIIPRMRGAHRSRAQADIVAEARQLIQDGVKELNLISQDSTYYGLDLRPKPSRSIASPERFQDSVNRLSAGATTLCTLLRELNEIPGDFWIRLLYTHPAHWTDELIRTIAACPKVARYVDMPLQHIHDNMLERMRRETDSAYITDLIQRIRSGIPGIALRTTFIVGFPGETERSFGTLLKFIRTIRFERLGVFTYSREDGTRAGKMAGQVSARVKERRREQAMAEQLTVSRALAARAVGKTMTVLTEAAARREDVEPAEISNWEHGFIRTHANQPAALRGPLTVARGQADAPDIDGRVYVRGALPMGQFVDVRIVGHSDYDLIAEPLISPDVSSPPGAARRRSLRIQHRRPARRPINPPFTPDPSSIE